LTSTLYSDTVQFQRKTNNAQVHDPARFSYVTKMANDLKPPKAKSGKPRANRRGFSGNDHVPSVPAVPEYLPEQVTPEELSSSLYDLREQYRMKGINASTMAEFWIGKMKATKTLYFAHEGVVQDEREVIDHATQLTAGKQVDQHLGHTTEQGKDGSRQNIIVITNIERE